MNDGHCTQATNMPYTYRVDDEVVGLCLHCFAENREPEACVFKSGRKGVRMHRKPKGKDEMHAKCCKPGIPINSDEYDCRMLHGKDFITFK